MHRLTVLQDGKNSTCKQVTKCISPDVPLEDRSQAVTTSGEKEKDDNGGVLETALDLSDTTGYDSAHYEAVSCMSPT